MLDNALLQARWRVLEQRTQELLTEVSTWPAERQMFRPSPDEWNALEVIDHLVRVEDESCRVVEENLAAGSRGKVSVREWCRAKLVLAVMRSPLRVKVPAGASAVIPAPATWSDFSSLRDEWKGSRSQIAQLLERFSPEQAELACFRHPVSGWMSVLQWLDFLAAHLRHHQYQIARLRTASGRLFPQGG